MENEMKLGAINRGIKRKRHEEKMAEDLQAQNIDK
jgi:hypothetical protein